MIDNYITGAGGFIGHRLAHVLAEAGSVVAIPHRDIISFKIDPFRRFFFLSAYGNIAGQNNPDDIYRANYIQIRRVCESSSGIDSGPVVYVSSSSVGLPFLTVYAKSKLVAEKWLLNSTSPTPFRIVRPFSVTGVGEQSCHLIPKLIRSCMTGEEMPFVGDAYHDFVDVEDVVRGLIVASEGTSVGPMELGSAAPYSNQEVLEMVQEATGKKANIKRIDKMRDYDSKDWCSDAGMWPDGWVPRKPLIQSITEMVEAYKHDAA